ncbi:hypothetical protein CIG75_03200 [Tumebacillus algifaecis]|uniref:Uncharacterized protein n=1 Tax=Tumebacillus algifaecis TaxID=1214604 RepID=A0A223CXJ9_9BACL|nr:hypothetical protein [Tumebacillus algifaecis]ASS74089.1 hypothetical protein CIG75_03200 [Tumebacillus algifaecis]
MTEWLSYLQEPLVLISIAGAFVVLTLFLDLNHNTHRLRQALLQLMLRAEKQATSGAYGSVSGPELMDLVVKKAVASVVPLLPIYLRPFLTEKFVRHMAQLLYEKAYDYLDDGQLNHSFVLDKRDEA